MKRVGLTAGSGMGLGIVFGAAFGHLALGMLIGMLAGAAVAAARRRNSRLVLFAAVLSQLPTTATAQSVQATPAAPALAERLDRLAAEFDRNRIDLHVPGAAIAIVRGEEVIFARGFGVADIEKKMPVTPETPFFIASTTKAFTATLVGMLVDEGRMKWDEPVETYLPEFKLKVQSQNPNDRATLRDILSHRTGFTRMLETNTSLSSDEILRRASAAEPLAPFRQRFLYNNENYVAAGWAAAAAANSSWEALIKTRILTPLGMAATRTSRQEAWNDPRMARGYRWDEAGQRVQPVAPEMLINIDGFAPAGAISSTVLDMTRWLRFLLRQGVQDGKPLISPAALTTTWTPQIQVGGGAGYGMGWVVRPWQGQRLIVHDGAISGYSAHVGLLPDSKIGFVVLTNTMSALPAIATQLVPQYLIGELPLAAGNAGDLKPYLGRYIANFATFSNEVFTVSERNGRLVLDMPSRLESALNPPRASNDDGQRSLVMTDQLAVSFDRDATGRVVGLKLHEGGLAFEVPREGVVLTPEVPLGELQKYVGRYGDAAGATEAAILIRNQRLAVRLPNNSSFDLLPPDATGRRATRANLGIAVTFEESPTGAVSAMNVHRPGAVPVLRLTPIAPLPTVDEIMTRLRAGRYGGQASATATMRVTGTVRFPQSALDGRFSSSSAGDDRLRSDLDLGSMQIRTVLNQGRAWAAVSGPSAELGAGASTRELTGKQLAQTRLGHRAVLFGDWRKYYDAVRVVRAGVFSGRKVYGIQLESAGLPPVLVAVDAETGDVLQTQQTLSSEVGAMPTTTTYSDYREIGGLRVPHRYMESNDFVGRAIYVVERVEVGVELAPDTFTLQGTSAPRASVPRP